MKITRRDFLKFSAMGGMTVMGEEAIRKAGRLVPYVIPPERLSPVVWHTLATTCRECPAGCGMHVRHRDGRITKAEGNPDHPVNRGGLCARGQSALQGIYDPDRIQNVLARKRGGPFETAGWEDAIDRIGSRMRELNARVAVIGRLETGSLAEIMTRFGKAFGSDRVLFFEPFHYDPLRKAHAALFGTGVVPEYRLDQCDYILSFGADFLETWISNVQFANQFSRMHSLDGGKIGYFTYIGPRQSMTACNADEFIAVSPGDQLQAALAILKLMLDANLVRQGRDMASALAGDFNPDRLNARIPKDRLARIARDFATSRNSVALSGPTPASGSEAEELALIVAVLNHAAGRFGTAIDIDRPHALSNTADEEAFSRFLNQLSGRDILFIHQANPVFTRPGSQEFIHRAGLVVYCGTMLDETAALSDWVLPVSSDLESWGDYEPYPGVYSLIQPTMAPILPTREFGDILLGLASAAGRGLRRSPGEPELKTSGDWVRQRFQTLNPQDSWEDALRRGGSWKTDAQAPSQGGSPPLKFRPGAIRPFAGHGPGPQQTGDQAELWLWSSVMLYDGRVSNRGWLQENPEPVSTITWGSWIDIHPDKAKKLGIDPGDVIELAAGNRRIQAPARPTREVEPGTVSLCLGQGHTDLGKIAAGLGANGFLLMPSFPDRPRGFFGTVSIRKTGKHEDIVTAMSTRQQHGRELLKWKTLSQAREMKPGPLRLPVKEGYSINTDLYAPHEHRGHRWAMTVDLQRCVGCQACAVACYAENNLFVVGRHQMKVGRQMPWLRIVPYRHPEKPGRIAWLPMPCQHCDDAPCEPVCPVFASVNNEEGVNAQIYNRCIGTRYCSNNCPYKVRRFNWMNTHWKPPLEWQLNPEVTVRCRGVMEKCTFCVQRIRNAEYRAVRENRPVRDGEIQPACVQSCPAKVYTFGDLLDPESLVSRIIHNDPRRYQVLQDLNTKPAVIYLYKIEQD